jgi:hypothetical protein
LKKSEGNLKRAASVKQLISIEQTGQRMADSHWNSWGTERDGGSRNGMMMMMMMMMMTDVPVGQKRSNSRWEKNVMSN